LSNLRTVQDWIVQRRLLTVEGVVQVNTWGGATKQYEVEIDLHKLDGYNVTLPQVIGAIGNANVNVGGREIRYGEQSVNIRAVGLLDSGGATDLTQGWNVTDIESIVLAQSNGIPIQLKDVASVRVGYVPRLGKAGRDREDDCRCHRGDEPHAAHQRRCASIVAISPVPRHSRVWHAHSFMPALARCSCRTGRWTLIGRCLPSGTSGYTLPRASTLASVEVLLKEGAELRHGGIRAQVPSDHLPSPGKVADRFVLLYFKVVEASMRRLIIVAVATHLLAASDYALAKGGFVRVPESVAVASMMVLKHPKARSPKRSPQKHEKGHPAVTPPG
jgi:hypothetical protein